MDVPCSGNFASDSEWFSRRTLADVERNAKVQKEILAEAVKCLAPNGEIVYSTCSLEPEEDELNIDWAVKNLGLQVQKINCLGVDGLTEVFGRKLDPQVKFSRRIWPEHTQGFLCMQTKKGRGTMKPYEVFASRFGSRVAFNSELVVEKNQRYYLLNPRTKKGFAD